MKIKIKYHSNELMHIKKIQKGDWVDLRASKDITLKKGEFALIPRSSTFKRWHIIQTNHMGVIDNSYSGDNDVWMMPVYATEDTKIRLNDRICQFRIVKKMGKVKFDVVKHLDSKDRGGFGSTGDR